MDNLEDIETVATVWPINSNGAGAIIVTTQKPCDVFHWTDYEIPLKPFPAEVGSEFLLRRLGDGIDAGGGERALIAQQISSNVGGLPLWLNALGGFITVSQCSLAECVDIFRSTLDPMDEGVLAGGCTYEKSPSAVFDLAFSKLTPDAKTLLCLLAFLDPDGVPESMLLVDNPGENLGVLDSAKRHRFFSAIANLRSSQLVKREGSDSDSDSCLTTHRSVQTAMLRKLDQDLEQRRMSFRDACFLIRRVFPRPSPLQQPEPDKWPLIQTYLPQLLSLEKAFRQTQPPIEGSTELAVLLSDVGLNAWDRGLGYEAKNLLQTAEAVLDSIGCDEWAMERSDIHVLLGIMTDTTGITQRAEGLRYRESAHRIRKRHIESIPPEKRTLEDEIRYYNTLTDLGCSYQHLNRHDEVAQICEEVLAKYRSWGTEEQFPYEFAKYYRHMSFVLVRRGDVQKAVEYSRQAIKLLELGNFGLLAASTKADCATMLYFNGEIREAVCRHQEVLQHRLQTLGRSNIMTIHSYLALGAICYFTDDMDNAEMYIREAVTQCRKSVPPREVALKARYYLYLVLAKQKKRDTDVNLGKWAEEIKADLQELLVLDESGFSRDKNIMDPVVFDYLIPWIYRTTVN
jgi:tetratricopeptide (TPR) repeat protein